VHHEPGNILRRGERYGLGPVAHDAEHAVVDVGVEEDVDEECGDDDEVRGVEGCGERLDLRFAAGDVASGGDFLVGCAETELAAKRKKRKQISVGYTYIMKRMDFFIYEGTKNCTPALHERRLERKPTARQGAAHGLHALERIHERSLVKTIMIKHQSSTALYFPAGSHATPEQFTNLVFVVDFLPIHTS
jgi:hypothetical protein